MRRTILTVACALLAASCTGTPTATPPSTTASPTPSAASAPASGPPPLILDVVASLSDHPSALELPVDDATYLDGIEMAVRNINAAGGFKGRPLQLRMTDDGGTPSSATTALSGVLDRSPLAILYVGAGSALTPLRDRVVAAGSPVILVQGDLYTSRRLFSPVFQTSIPWEWQAKVIAKYLVTDRKAKRIVFLGSGPESPDAAAATRDAVEYWGGHLSGADLVPPVKGFSPPPMPAARADAAIVFGLPHDVRGAVASLRTGSHPPRIVGGSSLLASVPGFDPLTSGTTACSTYTWAGWARLIPRVGEFAKMFESALGRLPSGFEQEGYDAVQALALALRRDGVRGGSKLTAALEGIHGRAFSSFPVDLGPDDHLFLPRDELGLFAVPGPREKLDPWQHRGDGELWRPVMRTFTYDGTRSNVLDRDKRLFFPFWRKNRPAPAYWRSRFGITSRPNDRLH
jgi:ABC-type branched-subunit amino acid transport system substrate-binding protein